MIGSCLSSMCTMHRNFKNEVKRAEHVRQDVVRGVELRYHRCRARAKLQDSRPITLWRR